MFDSLFGRGKSAPQPRAASRAAAHSSSTSRAGPGANVSDRGFSSNLELYTALFTDGYVVLPGMVDPPLVATALRAINCSLGRNVPNREQMCPDVATTPAVTNLYNHTGVKGIMDQLLREDTSVGAGQVAIRFPGDNTTQGAGGAARGGTEDSNYFQIPPGWEQHWHIDGLGDHKVKGRQSFFGDVRNFTALVGVVLQDAVEEYMGNLVVYPGSHSELQEHFRAHGFDDLYSQGVQGLPRIPLARGTRQITARAGDVVILNYCMAHSVAPNTSPYLRYNIYFRVTSQLHRQKKKQPLHSGGGGGSDHFNAVTGVAMSAMEHHPAAMLDVWQEWPGLRAALPPQALPLAQTFTATSDPSQTKTQTQTQEAQGSLSEMEAEEQRQLALALERSQHDR